MYPAIQRAKGTNSLHQTLLGKSEKQGPFRCPDLNVHSPGTAFGDWRIDWPSGWSADPIVPAPVRTASTGSSFPFRCLADLALQSVAAFAPTSAISFFDFACNSRRLSQIPYYEIISLPVQIDFRSQVRFVQNVLAMSVSDLASALGVSRQSVYKWISGGPITDSYRDRFEDLVSAANLLAPYGKATALSKRRDIRGLGLVEAMRSQCSARTWAEEVARLLRNEQDQRSTLDQVLAAHRRAFPARGEMGVPLLNEHGE